MTSSPKLSLIPTRQLNRALRKLYRKRIKYVNEGWSSLAEAFNIDINAITTEIERRQAIVTTPTHPTH